MGRVSQTFSRHQQNSTSCPTFSQLPAIMRFSVPPPVCQDIAPTLSVYSNFLSYFDHFELWCPSLENGHLFSLPPMINADSSFATESHAYRFPFGCGTPGRVWTMHCAESINDIASIERSVYYRRDKARVAGFSALVGVPVYVDNMPGGFPACVFIGYTKFERPLPERHFS